MARYPPRDGRDAVELRPQPGCRLNCRDSLPDAHSNLLAASPSPRPITVLFERPSAESASQRGLWAWPDHSTARPLQGRVGHCAAGAPGRAWLPLAVCCSAGWPERQGERVLVRERWLVDG